MKRFLSLTTTTAVVVVFCLIPRAVEARLNISGFFGYGYFFGFGEINDSFDEYYNSVYGTNLELGTGTAPGAEIEYRISPELVIRGETFSLQCNTADSYTELSPPYTVEAYIKGEAKATSVFLSGVYKPVFDESISFYLGAGMGIFYTEVEISTRRTYYLDGARDYEEIDTLRGRDNHWGFQVLGGAECRIGKNFVLQGEARILVSPSVLKEKIGKAVNWDGFFLSLGVGYEF